MVFQRPKTPPHLSASGTSRRISVITLVAPELDAKCEKRQSESFAYREMSPNSPALHTSHSLSAQEGNVSANPRITISYISHPRTRRLESCRPYLSSMARHHVTLAGAKADVTARRKGLGGNPQHMVNPNSQTGPRIASRSPLCGYLRRLFCLCEGDFWFPFRRFAFAALFALDFALVFDC